MLRSSMVAILLLAAESALVSQQSLRGGDPVPVVPSEINLSEKATPAARLQHVLPIAWVNVPYAGSHFANTLFHEPEICTQSILQAQAKTLGDGKSKFLVFHQNLHKRGHVMSRHEKHVQNRAVEAEHEESKQKAKVASVKNTAATDRTQTKQKGEAAPVKKTPAADAKQTAPVHAEKADAVVSAKEAVEKVRSNMDEAAKGLFEKVDEAKVTSSNAAKKVNASDVPTEKDKSQKAVPGVGPALTNSENFYAHVKHMKPEVAMLAVPDAPGTLEEFVVEHDLKAACAKGLSQTHSWWTHKGLGPNYNDNRKKAIILFRQPEQRILSSWYHSDDWWRKKTVPQYARMVSGCYVKMLTRDHPKPCEDPTPPTKNEVILAQKRLVEGFAFVGLSDRWSLTIGLWHKMFGGHCRDFELLEDKADSFQPYDTTRLEGFVDEYDGQLYREARKIFTDNVARYNISYTKPLRDCALPK